MDKKIKNEWIEALRSGEYIQGTGSLKNNNTYCCLGVLGKICGADIMENGRMTYKGDWSNGIGTLPNSLLDKAGIRGYDSTLIDKNDSGDTFMEIADWIEENL